MKHIAHTLINALMLYKVLANAPEKNFMISAAVEIRFVNPLLQKKTLFMPNKHDQVFGYFQYKIQNVRNAGEWNGMQRPLCKSQYYILLYQ